MHLITAIHRRYFIRILLVSSGTLVVLYFYSTFGMSSSLSTPLTRTPSVTTSASKYLAYIPHSGLSNQRIELANALLMASVLERTLIIPPAFLGRVVSWNGNRRSMAQTLEWLTIPKDFDTLCATTHDPQRLSSYVRSSKCQTYHDGGVIRWSDLHDLDTLRPYISFQYSDIISLDHLTTSLGLCNQQNVPDSDDGYGGINCGDIYVHYDKVRYDWRVYDNDTVRHNLQSTQGNYVYQNGRKEFYQLMSWKDWQQRPETLLYLDSIFGTTRLNVAHPGHVALKQRIMTALIYRMDSALGKTVSLIINKYLGNKAYLAVHFRTADKSFFKGIDLQVQNTGQQIEYTLAQHQHGPTSFCQLVDSTMVEDSSNKNDSIMTNIYMATDDTQPKNPNSVLAPWFKRYPCTVTLNDIPSSYLKPLNNIYDLVQPTKSLKPFLIPLVDSMIAAHASQVFLTPGSTFSGYIGQLHNAWLQDRKSPFYPL